MQKLAIGVNGKALYVNGSTGNGKIGAKGKAEPVSALYGKLDKGNRRRLRKALRRSGMASLAALPALPATV